jgi:hypothetical protein
MSDSTLSETPEGPIVKSSKKNHVRPIDYQNQCIELHQVDGEKPLITRKRHRQLPSLVIPLRPVHNSTSI